VKYFIVAGEASGDMHSARLVQELRQVDLDAKFIGWGGDKMKKTGVDILKHISELAFMGFSQVVLNIRTILNNFKLIKTQIEKCNPDAIILVDYPGFNLRLAKWAKEKGYTIIYYIAPQAWAWKENRVEKLKAYTDKLICILPFEKKFFEDRGLKVDYVGHPLLEQIELNHRAKNNTIALLPGSRRQEVKSMMPEMLSIVDNFPDYEFKIAQSPNLKESFYTDYINHERVVLHTSGMASLLNESKAALVTSGTATLETALYEVPQIVCYKSGTVSYQIAKRLIKVPYISLVNLIANKEVVKELIQIDLNKNELSKCLSEILESKGDSIKLEYREIKRLLGSGTASKTTAELIHSYLVNKR
jgi:lipid-A-disaccharide synthase